MGKIAATVGTFDGVHMGHQTLLSELVKNGKEKGLPTAVITFDVPPISVIDPTRPYQQLCSLEEKKQRLLMSGVDQVIIIEFNQTLSHLSAEDFMRNILRDKYHVEYLLVGYDHRFGYKRSEGFEDYREIGRNLGIEVCKSQEEFIAIDKTVSSSRIRALLGTGLISEANQLLGYNYTITGKVVGGFRIGRTLGYPTANIIPDTPHKLIPAHGVYAVFIHIGSKRFRGMLYIGNRPTFENGHNITIEVNIFDFKDDIYDRMITLELVALTRNDKKFDSMEELRDQIRKDGEQIQELLADY